MNLALVLVALTLVLVLVHAVLIVAILDALCRVDFQLLVLLNDNALERVLILELDVDLLYELLHQVLLVRLGLLLADVLLDGVARPQVADGLVVLLVEGQRVVQLLVVVHRVLVVRAQVAHDRLVDRLERLVRVRVVDLRDQTHV